MWRMCVAAKLVVKKALMPGDAKPTPVGYVDMQRACNVLRLVTACVVTEHLARVFVFWGVRG